MRWSKLVKPLKMKMWVVSNLTHAWHMEKAVIQGHVSNNFLTCSFQSVYQNANDICLWAVLWLIFYFLIWLGYFLLWSAYTKVLLLFWLGVCVCVFLIDLKCCFCFCFLLNVPDVLSTSQSVDCLFFLLNLIL